MQVEIIILLSESKNKCNWYIISRALRRGMTFCVGDRDICSQKP